jgi:cytochrome d ubiquinol oxidase subunit I
VDLTDIARWQFGITTVYHFLFVPITIGLSAIVAGMETAWLRTRNEEWLRLAKFFGKLFLINFAIGVVTGIVQEFQFGMNWSDYSRFVGDVFGAPLAVEGLLAFFLESTFLGLWIFGWQRLPGRLHAACMWIVHIATLLSAYFILAANSWMQHPVGYAYNPTTGRAEMHDFWAVMFNKVQLVTFPHTIIASYLTGGALVAGVAIWHVVTRQTDRAMYRRAARVGATIALVASIGIVISGDFSGKVMTEVQPMKMASAEALYNTEKPASFSWFTIGTPDGRSEKFAVKTPHLLSFLATGSTSGEVKGINQLRAEYEKTYGTDPGAAYYSADGYVPIIPVTYWSFRFMMGFGGLGALISLAILWLTRRGRLPSSRWLTWSAIALPMLPLLANTFGWIFSEMGRQPWAVFGLMTTSHAVSPGVSVFEAATSLVVLTTVYGVLAVVEVGLMLKYIKAGAPELAAADRSTDGPPPGDDRPLAFAY